MISLMVAFMLPLSALAYDQYESMNVGETKTFYFPSEVTSRASMMYSYNCSSDHINNVEIVSYTNTSVTVKALAYTQSQVNIRFDYWWNENNYGRHDTHMVHIDLNGGGGGEYTGSDYNPYNYDIDYGSWGTITVEVGQTTTVYCQYDIPVPSKVKSILWSDYQQLGNYDITYQSSSSCTIKGRFAYSGTKLWCLMKYGSNTFKAYYTVNVKESPKQTLSLSANPDGGAVDKGKTIYLTASDTSADIYYTFNGSTPTTSSTRYTPSGITINEDCTLKAVAKKSGYNDSPVMTWVYSVQEPSPVIAEINATNFPDANFRNYLLVQDYGKDGVLTEDEISQITSIDVYNKDISSLKGIEYFTALTNLKCYENLLTTLDVSKNTALTRLNCGYNQLTTMDVSMNTALKEIKCYNNQLTTLDVSKNTLLTELDCGGNQLTTLDMSKNMVLTELDCRSNQLTTLDLSNNTALKKVYCHDNQLTILDVSNSTALTYLNCTNNQLAALDVSKNTALAELWCYENQLTDLDVSKNTALTDLYCYSNQLTALDLSKNTALHVLYCNYNELTSLDLSKNTELRMLRTQSNPLTSLDVSKNTALTSLSCANNQLTSLDVSKNTALTILWCYENKLTSLDVSKNTALEYLYCYNNMIKGETMDALINGLPQNTTDNEPRFNIIDPTSEKEGNVCTKTQVAAVKAKGWFPCYYDSNSKQYVEYEGSEDTSTPAVISSVSADTKAAAVYTLSGQRLAAPRKGVNIIGGKKMVIK